MRSFVPLFNGVIAAVAFVPALILTLAGVIAALLAVIIGGLAAILFATAKLFIDVASPDATTPPTDEDPPKFRL